MARGRHDLGFEWIAPIERGVLPLDGFHVSRKLRRLLRRAPFRVSADEAFQSVITACATPRAEGHDTWINEPIERVFGELHAMGLAHSIEAWDGEELAGGLYGLGLGGAFFGESMFSRRDNASKVALVHLVALLRRSGFMLLDAQFLTEHLAQFGAISVPAAAYLCMLDEALSRTAIFQRDIAPSDWSAAVEDLLAQSMSQRS